MSLNSKSLPPPTAEQKRRWDLIRARGCIVARKLNMGFVPCEIHHLKSGNVRMGHDFTIGLSAYTHRGEWLTGVRCPGELGAALRAYGTSLADGSRKFREAYGPDAELLRYQNELIDWTKPPVRERNRKSRCTASPKQAKRPEGFWR